jgi:hypothetical protein
MVNLAAAVPEPAGFAILTGFVCGLTRRRRYRG